MIPLLVRQRRRLLICATLLTLSVQISAMGTVSPPSQAPLWVAPVSAALFFLGCAVTVGVIVLTCPALREICEVVTVFVLFETLFIRVAPELNAELGDGTMRIAVAFLLLALIARLLHGGLLDGLSERLAMTLRHKVGIRADAEEVWTAVVPDRTRPAHHWAGLDFAVQADPDAPDTVHLSKAPDAPGPSVTFVTRARPVHCRYLFSQEPNRPWREDRIAGAYDFRIVPQGDGVLLHITLGLTGLRFRDLLRIWLDDTLGAEGDALRARLEGASMAPTRAAIPTKSLL